MGTFDYGHYEEMNELLFHKYNNNKFIDEHMAYVIDGDSKFNII